MTVRVKICGITNLPDALAAVDAGADALGFMFYAPSPRNIDAAAAAEIIAALPPMVSKVGVFVDPERDFVLRTLDNTGIDTLQFHGVEPPEFLEQFRPLSIYKALRVRSQETLGLIPRYPGPTVLLDSYSADAKGGTGETFPWHLALQGKQFGKGIILAGGLSPENVRQAVDQVAPFAVDVSSGVESEKGKKDADKVQRFIRNAKTTGSPTG